jgi:hypothetical protein
LENYKAARRYGKPVAGRAANLPVARASGTGPLGVSFVLKLGGLPAASGRMFGVDLDLVLRVANADDEADHHVDDADDQEQEERRRQQRKAENEHGARPSSKRYALVIWGDATAMRTRARAPV